MICDFCRENKQSTEIAIDIDFSACNGGGTLCKQCAGEFCFVMSKEKIGKLSPTPIFDHDDDCDFDHDYFLHQSTKCSSCKKEALVLSIGANAGCCAEYFCLGCLAKNAGLSWPVDTRVKIFTVIRSVSGKRILVKRIQKNPPSLEPPKSPTMIDREAWFADSV